VVHDFLKLDSVIEDSVNTKNLHEETMVAEGTLFSLNNTTLENVDLG
jgi:hypothetical protein